MKKITLFSSLNLYNCAYTPKFMGKNNEVSINPKTKIIDTPNYLEVSFVSDRMGHISANDNIGKNVFIIVNKTLSFILFLYLRNKQIRSV